MLNVFKLLAAFLAGVSLLTLGALGASVTCTSASLTTPSGGGAVTLNVDCQIIGIGLSIGLPVSPTSSNAVSPSTLNLVNGSSIIPLSLQAAVSSPDNSVITLIGTASGGFTAIIASIPATIRFQYKGTTTASTKSGSYTSATGTYNWGLNALTYGTSNFNLQATVPVITSVSCNSPSVNATGGGGSYTLTVTCTLTGNANQLTPINQNLFTSSSITLSNGASTLTSTLQPTPTSPDGSITGIAGTAGGGFSGTITSLPAKIQVNYTGTTTSTLKAGSYVSAPINYTWSTL